MSEWQLIEEPGISYFKLQWQNNLCLYSTKIGNDEFLRRFKPILLKQVHSATIIDLDKENNRIGDGLISSRSISLGIKVADCLPVYLFSKERICMLHCGWRPVLKGIAKIATQILADYRYCLGASIGSCCYEISMDLAQLFKGDLFRALIYRDKKVYLDLKKAVVEQLGKERLIASLDYCTKCYPHYFYSYRGADINKRNYAVAIRR